MAWDGSGTFNRTESFQGDRDAGLKILSAHVDDEFDNFKVGLQNCITRDGQVPATANLPMGSHRITGLADGTASTDAATVAQVSTGSWQRNLLINPSFRFWQRYAYTGSTAVVGTAAGLYCADRWFVRRDGVQTGYTVTQVLPASVSVPSQTAIKIQRDSGNTSIVPITLAQSLDLDDVKAITCTGKTLLLSFYCKTGTNFSSAVEVATYANTTNASANAITTAGWASFSGVSYPALYSGFTTAWTRFVVAVGAHTLTSLSIGVRFTFTPVGTAGADDSFYLGGVKLELVDSSISSALAASSYIDPPLGEELLKCQRYYWKTFPLTTAPAQNAGVAGSLGYKAQIASTTAGWMGQIPLPVLLRAPSSVTLTAYNPSAANAKWRNATGAADSGTASLTAATERCLELTNPQVAADAAADVIRVHATADNEY